ncbi:MAG: response regulator [Spirochaetales bacterium]|nr:response regulator [Spirochaetales bacterium]
MADTAVLTGKKIIIADDEDFIRQHLGRRLSGMGLEVLEAATGQQVLDLLSTFPDLILMDVRMPEVDGYETTRIIKSAEDTSGIPVILLSALAEDDDIRSGYNAGADEFLCKPVTFAVILESISRNLSGRQIS